MPEQTWPKDPVTIVMEVRAPQTGRNIHTVYNHHCFVCHCFIEDLSEYERHSWNHQVMHQLTLTARSVGEAAQLNGLLARYKPWSLG